VSGFPCRKKRGGVGGLKGEVWELSPIATFVKREKKRGESEAARWGQQATTVWDEWDDRKKKLSGGGGVVGGGEGNGEIGERRKGCGVKWKGNFLRILVVSWLFGGGGGGGITIKKTKHNGEKEKQP